MQHIINVAFDFDDAKITKIVEEHAEAAVKKSIDEIVLDFIAPITADWRYGMRSKEEPPRSWAKLNEKVNMEICKFIEERKDEIIDLAATKLVESYKRTKAWKEKAEKVLED